MLIIATLAFSALQGSDNSGKNNQDNAGEIFFQDETVHELQIEVADSALEALKKYDRKYTHALIREGNTLYVDVGIHLKGMGSFRPLDQKPSFTVKLNEFTPDQKFHGLTKIMLNNCVQDTSHMSDALATELFRAADVPAARVTYAHLWFNGRDLGLYQLADGINKPFLKHHFGNGDGNLYEGTAKDITEVLDQDNGKQSDQSDLKRLAEAAQLTDSTERLKHLERVLDLDRFITHIVMEVLVWHWDGYALNRNNYRVYHDPHTDKMVFLPHGMDQMFWQPEAPIFPKMNGLLARAILQTPEGRQRYRERMTQLMTNVFTMEKVTNRISQLTARIRPVIAERGANAVTDFDNAAGAFQTRVLRRIQNVQAQLLSPQREPLKFDASGVAKLSGWNPRTIVGNPGLSQADHDGKPALYIKANGPSTGSWRNRVLLDPGNYRFECRIRTAGIAISAGIENGGAGIRLSGGQTQGRIVGDADWTKISHRFTPRTDEVELICELTASQGEAWFNETSLVLIKENN